MTRPIWNWETWTVISHCLRGLACYPIRGMVIAPFVLFWLLRGDIHRAYLHCRQLYADCWPRWFDPPKRA